MLLSTTVDIVALTAVVVCFIARRSLPLLHGRRRDRMGFLVAMIFAFCTSAWSTAGRSLWQHGPSLLFLALAVLLALRAQERSRNLAPLGAVLVISYIMRPTNSIAIVLFSLGVLLFHRKRLVGYILGALPPAAVFVAVNYANYGQLLTGYYRAGRLGAPADGRSVHFSPR